MCAMRSRYALVTSTGEIFFARRCSDSVATSKLRISLDGIATILILLTVETSRLSEEVRIPEGRLDSGEAEIAEMTREREDRARTIRHRVRVGVGDFVIEDVARDSLNRVAIHRSHRRVLQQFRKFSRKPGSFCAPP